MKIHHKKREHFSVLKKENKIIILVYILFKNFYFWLNKNCTTEKQLSSVETEVFKKNYKERPASFFQ